MRDDLQQYDCRRIESPNKVVSHKSPSGWLPAIICAALILAAIAAYEPLRDNDFINLDDPRYVTENLHVRAGITFEGIKWAFITGETSHWHPLTLLLFALGLMAKSMLVTLPLVLLLLDYWPHQLAVFYPLDANTLPVWQVVLAALLLSGLSIWVGWLSPKYRYLLAG